jgi:hypothetical protein
MAMIEVPIERYSLAAAALLQRHTPRVGRIHSCYARILNIQTSDGELLTLQGPGWLQAPCAASLAVNHESCATRCVPGDLVAQAREEPAALHLVTAGATLWDGRLLPMPNLTTATHRDAADQLIQWLVQHARERGIVPVLDALHGVPVRSPLHRRICNALATVLAGRRVSADAVEDLAARVIGLGEGLTPSGDDLLVGFLAVLHLAGYAPMLLHAPNWLNSLMANTTDLSAAFILGALKGHFSEPIVRFMQVLYRIEARDWHARAADLARVGHSSGVDAMVGMAFANQLLASADASPTPYSAKSGSGGGETAAPRVD